MITIQLEEFHTDLDGFSVRVDRWGLALVGQTSHSDLRETGEAASHPPSGSSLERAAQDVQTPFATIIMCVLAGHTTINTTINIRSIMVGNGWNVPIHANHMSALVIFSDMFPDCVTFLQTSQ